MSVRKIDGVDCETSYGGYCSEWNLSEGACLEAPAVALVPRSGMLVGATGFCDEHALRCLKKGWVVHAKAGLHSHALAAFCALHSAGLDTDKQVG